MNKKNRKFRKKNGPSIKDSVDRYALYEQSVQNVEFEIEFVAATYHEIRNCPARSLREDFCGTAGAACEWVRQHDENTAIGVDLDQEVLEWGRLHNVSRLKPQQALRLVLLQDNVLHVKTDPVDVVLAMNFSYWCFKSRAQLKDYFAKVYRDLADRGVFFLDAYGGYEAYNVLEEETEHESFTYVWDQAYFNPVTADYRCHIHFKFPDGSKLKNVFTYEWRLWTLPEIREVLAEVGFKRTVVYMQGWDEATEDATDEFFPTEEADPDPGWVAYITAEK